MFAVYCLLLEMNRIYVGETPSWRLETRWAEHANPSRGASKWTSKYPPKKKLCIFKKKIFFKNFFVFYFSKFFFVFFNFFKKRIDRCSST